jgi:hypothetical protein
MTTKTILTLLIVFSITTQVVTAQSLGYNNNRIAISADGNNQADNHSEAKWPRADPDDWGGTPAALAMIAKVGLQDRLVHFSYNNFINAQPHTTETNYMADGVNGAIQRWNFDVSRFFDVPEDNAAAINHLAKELKKSTAADPLYFIHMGPSEFLYRTVSKVVNEGYAEALAHVYVISHSGYNDNHLRRYAHHTMNEVIELSGNRLQYKKIKDQNACGNPEKLWCSATNFTPFHWMRDHSDEDIQFLYSRLQFHPDGKGADISDAGMVWYLLKGDENGSLPKFKNFIGASIVTKQCVIEENNGLLVFEAERFKLKGKWKLGRDAEKASGGKYIYFDGPNSYKGVNMENVISYTFKINNPGNYSVKWMMRQPNGERGTDKGNDVWIYFSNDIGYAKDLQLKHFEKYYGRSDDNFTLNGVAEIHGAGHGWLTAKFTKTGTYTLNIGGRSHGLQIDKLLFFKDLTVEEAQTHMNKISETSDCSTLK